MLIAYVDESYNKDLYFMGAAVAEFDAWSDFDDRLNALRTQVSTDYKLPASIEFHGHELMGGTHEWTPMRSKHREAASIYEAALKLGTKNGVRYLFRSVDVRRLNARYKYPRPPHVVTMDHLLERLDDYARRNSAEKMIVVADQHSMEDKLKELFDQHQVSGTDGYRPSLLSHISAPLNFARSCDTPGLELVDLALYVHQRCRTVPDEAHRVAQRSRDRLARQVYPNTVHAGQWNP